MILYLTPGTCLDLPPLTNGAIVYSSPTQEGTTATHSCDSGYVLSGGTVRTCQSDGIWSGRSIVCQRKLQPFHKYYVL